jgi:natural product biosynthesis luciferase-like monooxygenase protein
MKKESKKRRAGGSLAELLRERAAEKPNQIGYRFFGGATGGEVCITYGELDARARRVAFALCDEGVQGERVLLFGTTGLDFIVSFFGILYAGGVAVPLSPPRPSKASRVQAIVRDAKPKLGIWLAPSGSGISQIKESDLGGLRLRTIEELEAGKSGSQELEPSMSESLALLQYTSGSTGRPKGVCISHENLIHNATSIAKAARLNPESVSVNWLPLYHDMGLMSAVVAPFFVGYPVTLLSPNSFLTKPLSWLETMSRQKATFSGGPNFAYELCCEKITDEQCQELELSSWQVAFCGAEVVRSETVERFVTRFEPYGFRRQSFFPCYGLAEATLMVSGGPAAQAPRVIEVKRGGLERRRAIGTAPGEDGTRLVSCGCPVDGQTVVIVEPASGVQCSDGQIGEVWISGRSVSRGYWNNPEETSRTFCERICGEQPERFLKSGDLGFLHEGNLFVVGRLKDLIIIRGVNHYAEDIEATIDGCHAGLVKGAVAAFSIESDGAERLVVVLEQKRTWRTDTAPVLETIAYEVLAEHAIEPYAIVLIRQGTLPKTTSGKVRRRATKANYLAGELETTGEWSAKNQVRGHRIEPGEIEAALKEQPGVAEAAAIVGEEVLGEKRVWAYVVPGPGKTAIERTSMDFSLFYFAEGEIQTGSDLYRLYLESAKLADEHGFKAVWTPERHFTDVAAAYPNPSVLSAALAMITKRVQLRAGSVVLPLHHPVRVAEEWSVVDNLSGGRVGLSFASGWVANDFVFAPEHYGVRHEKMVEGVQQVMRLWRGEGISLVNGVGQPVEVKILPRPVQAELPVWLTGAQSPKTFETAGKLGVNILSALLNQTVGELAKNINIYRRALEENGYDPATRTVTVMLHTYVDENHESAVQKAREALRNYFRSHTNLRRRVMKEYGVDLGLDEEGFENHLSTAVERYLKSSSLIGSPASCFAMIDRLKGIGVNEIACLIDFGVDVETVLGSLPHLAQLAGRSRYWLGTERLRADLRERLPEYMVPGAMVIMDKLPLTANGELDRKGLPVPEWQSRPDYVEPRNRTEELLCSVFC